MSKKQHNSNNIKNKHNNQIATSDTFKASDETTEEPYNNKRGLVENTIKRATTQQMPPIRNPTDTSGDTAETVNSETMSPPKKEFPTSINADESNLNSDGGTGTTKKRAFEHFPTYPQAPIIDRKRAISVMAIEVDDHRKKHEILSE